MRHPIDLFLVSSQVGRSTIDLDLYMSGTVLQTQHYVYDDLMIAH